jgi:two-component system sensor histidine kinase/response regulator
MTDYSVLYVDDEPENLVVFTSNFKRIFKVYTAQSASEGLSLLDRESIHLVITDHRMPEMSGVQLLEVVKEKYPDIMRIILTAYTNSEDIINAINKGGVYYFVKKPWVGAELKALMDKTLSFYALREQNKQLIHRLHLSIRELEMFYYRISHDLRGPLASQAGIISLAKADKNVINFEKYINMMEDSSVRLEKTLKKIESSRVLHSPDNIFRKVDLVKILESIKKKLQDEITIRNVVLEEEVSEDIELHSNINFIRTIVENLIENAVFFSDDEKPQRFVRIKLIKQEEQFVISVEDNGVGIEPGQLDKIFDPFYRGHVKSKGNGLGLYIVKKAIESVQGDIQVESKENVSTCVTVSIPVKGSL